jgi:predicted HNH restriction endonuclease
MFNKKIDSYYQFPLKKINLLEDKINLLVVDWGKSTKSWKQWLWDGDKAKSIVSYGDGREYENEGEIEYSEGREYFRLHKLRERKPLIIVQAKERFVKKHGRLYCEVCGTDFSIVYGERGNDFIEGHHNKLVSKMKEGDKTKVEDIAMLCSNCHRMIHREPIITVEQLAQGIYGKGS